MRAITFYSFKGGVGRTMLATNVAGLLAEAGQRVLLVDFDLEAPGLSFLEELQPKPGEKMPRGVAGFLADSLEAKQIQDSTRYCYTLEGFQERLRVMPAGNVHATQFGADTNALHSAEFFNFAAKREAGLDRLKLFYDLRQQWQRDFDYVLIDSRTGLTDIGGVCTRLLPDEVVVIVTLAEQGLTGVRRVLDQISNESLYGLPLKTRVVLSMVPAGLAPRDVLNERIKVVAERLGHEVDPSDTLAVVPDLLIREQPFYFRTPGPVDPLQLAYQRITNDLRAQNEWDVEFRLEDASKAIVERRNTKPAEDLLRALTQEEVLVSDERALVTISETAWLLLSTPSLAGDVSRLRPWLASVLRRALDRFDGTSKVRASALFALGQIALQDSRIDEAEVASQQALTLVRQVGDERNEAAILHQLGLVAEDRKNLDGAEHYYRESLAIVERLRNDHGRAQTLYQLGMVAQNRQRPDIAAKYYLDSLALAKQLADYLGWAQALHQLGLVAEQDRQFDKAERYYQDALSLEERAGNDFNRAGTLYHLGRVAFKRGRSADAVRWYEQARSMFSHLGDSRWEKVVSTALERVQSTETNGTNAGRA